MPHDAKFVNGSTPLFFDKVDDSFGLLSRALSLITPKTVLVIGDLILDRYTLGRSQRISPEAPVPVVLVDKEEVKAGGAGNVALNLIAMGMRVRLIGRVGDDESGKILIQALRDTGVDVTGVITETGFRTPSKNRIIASSQQLLRVDSESVLPLAEETQQNFIRLLPSLFQDVSLVAVSDYAKGTLSQPVLRAVIDMAQRCHIPCITDPKGADFRRYSGSTILKPNATETLRAAPSATSLEEAAKMLLKTVAVDVLMVTRSEEGISLFFPDGRHEHYPVSPKEVRDVTGAGDTVLAMVSSAIASGISLSEAVQLANVAASCAVERLGCAQVSSQHIAKHVLDQTALGRVCTSDEFLRLLPALRQEQLLFVNIPTSTMSPEEMMKLTETVARHPHQRAIACFTGEQPDKPFLGLVSSLRFFDLVVHGCSGSFPLHEHTHVSVSSS